MKENSELFGTTCPGGSPGSIESMVINVKLKLKKIIVMLAVLTAVLMLAGCKAALSDKEPGGSSVSPPVTELPHEIGDDTHFCTVTDQVTQREFTSIAGKREYIFRLPGGIDLKNLTFNCYVGKNYSVTVNGETYTESIGVPLDASGTDGIKVTFTNANGSTSTLRYTFAVSSTNLLFLNIDESLGTVEAMHGDKSQETYCYGSLSYISTEGQYDFASSFSLKGRGNATWDDEKKGYALKLYESGAYAEKNKIALSGMGKSEDWVLLANHRDRTLIRNALAQTLAAKLGMESAVEFVFVDLYINGEYNGLYMLTEKVQSGKEQVDITEAEDDSLNGGYLLEFDNYSDTPQIKMKRSGQRVTVKSPDGLESYTAIEKRLSEAEIALFDSKGYNKQTGKYWYDYIDLQSFAILWMVREYTMDYDANVNFRFYYDPSDGKFHGGPAWDFDNSMARTTGVYADPEFALIESGERSAKNWLTMLMRFDAFKEEIVRLYNEHIELFTTEDSDSIYALALRYYTELSYSIEQNFTVWKHQLANKSWNVPEEPTYDGHFGILTDFLERRNAFWRTYIPELAE